MNATPKFKIPADTLAQLSKRSDSKGLIQLAAHVSLLVLAGIAFSISQGLISVASFLLYGATLTFLFAPLHESIHFTAFKSRWLNDAVAAVTGFLLLIPFRYFRAFHYAHHRHTRDSQKDPELIDTRPLQGVAYWVHISGIAFWRSNLQIIYRHAMGTVNEPFIDASKHAAIIREARIHLAAYLFLLAGSIILSTDLLWWYWLLPVLITQPLLRLFLLAEHGGCDFSDNMLENSRTTYTTPLLGFLCWNMNYHAEHHYLASIPFHALPALHAYTGQKVKFKGDGYFSVNREIAAQR